MAARSKVLKLFVGNLPWTVGNTELLKYFSQFGPLSSAKVVFDKASGLSKGYGFVVFKSKDSLDSALGKPIHQLEGHSLTVNNIQDQ